MVVDSSLDITILYDISEEEEEQENEKNKELEVFVTDTNTELVDLTSANNNEGLAYEFKAYPKPHLNLIFPPPEFIS
jgi:glutamine synthetase adenylyltransferase